MGSPETCPLCHSDYPSVRNLAGNINDRYVCTHRWHDTPPAPADDAGGALMPKDVPGAAEFRDAFKAAVLPRGADHASWVNGYCAGWIACDKAFPLPARDDAVEEAMDDEAANIERRIGALDKARPGYIARLVRGICGKPVAYICVECGALWRKVKIPSDTAESWNMVSAKGCAGCDNGPKPLFDALYREPASAPARPTAADDAVVEAAREIDDARYSFFYAALAYAKARSLARTGADVAILGATEAIFDRAFENLGDDATWLSVAAERDAALRGANGGE